MVELLHLFAEDGLILGWRDKRLRRCGLAPQRKSASRSFRRRVATGACEAHSAVSMRRELLPGLVRLRVTGRRTSARLRTPGCFALAPAARGAGTRACRVQTHRDARRTCTQARPDESGRGRLRVRATSAHSPVTQGTKLHPGWYDNVVVWPARPRMEK